MENVWITLITVFGGTIATLIGFLIKNSKEKRELKKRDSQLKELCNYAFGTIDMIIQDEVKVTPEVRGAMKKVSKRYHKLDLVKELTKQEEKEDIKENK